eukprot:Skav209720  [mRNA]  locus=scaffold528:235776:239908:+ [translate_table: standard]
MAHSATYGGASTCVASSQLELLQPLLLGALAGSPNGPHKSSTNQQHDDESNDATTDESDHQNRGRVIRRWLAAGAVLPAKLGEMRPGAIVGT